MDFLSTLLIDLTLSLVTTASAQPVPPSTVRVEQCYEWKMEQNALVDRIREEHNVAFDEPIPMARLNDKFAIMAKKEAKPATRVMQLQTLIKEECK